MMSGQESGAGNNSSDPANSRGITSPGQNNGSVYWDIEQSYPPRSKSPWVRRGHAQSPNDGSPSKDGVDMEMQGLIYHDFPGHSKVDSKGQPVSLVKRIRFHFIRFCETTSLRGIPRIVKTKDKKRKCLWASFVLTFFAGAITCLVFLAIQYSQYDVIHQPKTMKNYPTPFPTFTVCNTHPLSVEGKNLLKEKNVLFPSKWTKFSIGKAKAYRQRIGKRFTDTIFRYLNMMFSLSAWLQTLPDDVPLASIGQLREEMILKCEGSVKTGDYVFNYNCDDLGVWINTFSVAFVNCYSFTVHEIYRNKTTSLNINIYLGEATPSCESCLPHILATQVEGVRLEVHPAGTYPSVDEKGLYLMPGSLTEIRFSTREWNMIEPPHGNCSESLVKNNMTLDAVNFTYSVRTCNDQKYQDTVANLCDCVDFERPIPEHLSEYRTNRRYCQEVLVPPSLKEIQNFSFNHDIVSRNANRTLCALNIKRRVSEEGLGCLSPCIYYTYESSVSSTRWPSPSFHTQFRDFLYSMDTMAKKQLMKRYKEGNRSAIFRRKLSNINRVFTNMKKQLRHHENNNTLSEFFEKRFLAIQVSRPSFDIERVEEKAVISLTSFLSQVGGLLSIWVGLSFVCIVEVIELLLNITDTIFNR